MEQLLTGGIAVMAESGILPWSGVLVEPLKILFFNNWLNHGFLLPLGMEQVHAAGGSILFLLEENPGPGFGILAACALTVGTEKRTRRQVWLYRCSAVFMRFTFLMCWLI